MSGGAFAYEWRHGTPEETIVAGLLAMAPGERAHMMAAGAIIEKMAVAVTGLVTISVLGFGRTACREAQLILAGGLRARGYVVWDDPDAANGRMRGEDYETVLFYCTPEEQSESERYSIAKGVFRGAGQGGAQGEAAGSRGAGTEAMDLHAQADDGFRGGGEGSGVGRETEDRHGGHRNIDQAGPGQAGLW